MTIKVGSVSLPLHQHQKGWRVTYRDASGRWKYITRKDKAEAVRLGKEKAQELNNGAADLSKVSQDTAALLQRVLALGISHADLDSWSADRKRPVVTVATAFEEFLTQKKANEGRSQRNVRSLRTNLAKLVKAYGEKPLRSVTLADLETWLTTSRKAPKGRKNIRTSAVTFFRWARKRDYLPDAVTVAEKLEPPKVPRSIPETWSPAEFQTLLNNCPPDYLPWLILAGQAGFRHEELFAEQSSGKSPLDWSDFHWDRSLIIVRPETSKNDERRVVPILPAVRAWLYPRRKEEGRVVPARPPHKTRKLAPAITAALGEHVGGWRQNALRHSFISYRAAQVGLAQTAMEAGNSEKEARKSYNDAKGADHAAEWFAVVPGQNSSEPPVLTA